MAAASIITYGGVAAIVLTLTIASIVVPIAINRDWQVLASVMAVLYAVALFLLIASYKSTFGINIEKMDEWAKSAHDSFSRQFKTTHGYEEWS